MIGGIPRPLNCVILGGAMVGCIDLELLAEAKGLGKPPLSEFEIDFETPPPRSILSPLPVLRDTLQRWSAS